MVFTYIIYHLPLRPRLQQQCHHLQATILRCEHERRMITLKSHEICSMEKILLNKNKILVTAVYVFIHCWHGSNSPPPVAALSTPLGDLCWPPACGAGTLPTVEITVVI